MSKCVACGAIMRRDDVYQGDEATPIHEGCLASPDTSLSKTWTLDNGEADDAAATAAEQAGQQTHDAA